jgi:hypothetical protein
MISDKHKFIFNHPPRTAGTIFETEYDKAFKLNIPSELERRDGVVSKFYPKPPGFERPLSKHMQADEYKMYFPKKWEEYFKFSIVRTPWEHVVSCYYLSRKQASKLKKQSSSLPPPPSECYTFEEWFQKWGKQEINCLDKYLFIKDEMILDSVVAYESYDKDMSKIWKTLFNIETPYKMIEDKRGAWDVRTGAVAADRPLDYREHYTNKKHIDMVREFYPKTIEYFGYKF